VLDFVVFDVSLLGKDFSKQQTKLRNIPLTVSEVIQKFALCVVGIDFERQIERSARSNDTKLLIEHNDRFSNRIDNSVRKCPSILDLGELLSEHVSEHGEAGLWPGSRFGDAGHFEARNKAHALEVQEAWKKHGANVQDHIRNGRRSENDGQLLKQGMKAVDLNGSATVDINLSGFPRGTKATASSEGLFKSVKLNRGRPMASASQDA
jgi:hypothetical protein